MFVNADCIMRTRWEKPCYKGRTGVPGGRGRAEGESRWNMKKGPGVVDASEPSGQPFFLCLDFKPSVIGIVLT